MGIIRLLLALSVLATHTYPIFGNYLVGGKIAVQAFYMISGFYMSLILNQKYIGQKSSYKLFITNRLLRLYPTYWMILICCVLFALAAEVHSNGISTTIFDAYSAIHFSPSSAVFVTFTNIFLLGQDWVMFMGIDAKSGHLFFTGNFWETDPALYTLQFIRQSWTLGVEIAFYLIAPFLLRKGWKLILCLLLLSLVIRLALAYGFNLKNDPWDYRFFPSELLFFLLGYFSYRLQNAYIFPKWSGIASILVITLYAIGYQKFSVLTSVLLIFEVKDIIFFALIFFGFPALFQRFKSSSLDKQIGDLSYPVYLSHNFIAACCFALHLSFLKTGVAMSIITVIFALMLNKWVADPIELYRQRRIRNYKT